MMNERENLKQQVADLFPQVLRWARKYARTIDPEDLAQTVMAELLGDLDRLAGVHNLAAWAAVVTRSRAIDAIRAGGRLAALPEMAEAAASDDEPFSPEARRMWEAFEEACRQSKYPETLRGWAWKHYGEGWTQTEIAAECATSIVKVKAALFRLRKLAREIFEKEVR